MVDHASRYGALMKDVKKRVEAVRYMRSRADWQYLRKWSHITYTNGLLKLKLSHKDLGATTRL